VGAHGGEGAASHAHCSGVALTTEEMEVELGLGSSRASCDVVSRLRGTLCMLYGTATYLLGLSTTRGTMTRLHAVLV
jgi:hypothetical protein